MIERKRRIGPGGSLGKTERTSSSKEVVRAREKFLPASWTGLEGFEMGVNAG